MYHNPNELIAEAKAVIARAESQGRDLSEFESGRVDALLDVANRERQTHRTREEHSTR